ncbi:MAG: hypothetical protein OJJ54_17995 [Pseudonocardia sp.]|nr:hypothetical protein [Pseudonocardia sp.]
MSYLLGIDLGANRTVAAVGRPDRPDAPEIVALGHRSMDAPTVLFLGEDGTVAAGEAAEERAAADPDRAAREFTERIGSPEPLVVAGVTWQPEELCARMVRWVVNEVADQEGGPADAVAIARPASWGSRQQDLLAAALGGHGMAVTFVSGVQATGAVRALADGAEPYAPTTLTPAFDDPGYEPPVRQPTPPPYESEYEQQYASASPDEPRTSRIAVPPAEIPPSWSYPDEPTTAAAPGVEYDVEEPRPALGRTPATMVGIGGALGALALVGTIVFWPADRVTNTASVITPASTTAPVAPTTTAESVAPTTTEAPATSRTTPRRTTTAPPPTTTEPPSSAIVPPPPDPPTETTTETTTPPASSAPPTTTTPASPPGAAAKP